MTQRFSLYDDLTVFENLDFVAARLRDAEPARRGRRRCIERMGLGDRRDQLAGQLSGGWKQRLALAACVLHQPKLLLLDEPTAGVDAKARREFWDLIHDMAADGLTTLVSTHYMDEAERCSRIVYLAHGRIVVQGGAGDGRRRVRASSRSRRPARTSTPRRGGCATRRASRRRRCSAARCTSPAWTAPRCRRAIARQGDGLAVARGRAAARGRVHPHAERARRRADERASPSRASSRCCARNGSRCGATR